jgi:transposase
MEDAAVEAPTQRVFELGLGLTPPWHVVRIAFDPAAKRLEVHLDFEKGSRWKCPDCEVLECPVHDTVDKEWRHLNFFQHEAYLHARVPRVRCQEHGVLLVGVPWARAGSGFTLLFEALLMAMMEEMPVKATGQLVGEHDTRLWRVLLHYVDQARAQEDHSEVTKVGVDETSHKRGQSYVTLFADLDRAKVLFATPGRDQETVARFKADLLAHGGHAEQIREFSADMSPAFKAGIETNFESASLTLDKYHVTQLVNAMVDEVRRVEQQSTTDLKKSRYLWLKNPSNLTTHQRQWLRGLRRRCRQTARAYEYKLNFTELWDQPQELAEIFLIDWCESALRTRMPALDALRTLACTVVDHCEGILRWFQTRINNGVMEAINSLVRAAKRRARGYRTDRNYIAMIYIIAGKLSFNLPT